MPRKRTGPACLVCSQPIDPVWAGMGYRVHVSCEDGGPCPHGEDRGARYCALCRKARA